VLKATILSKKPEIKIDKQELIASSKSKQKCKELFSVEVVAKAIEDMELRYKNLDEIDIYNLIVYILDS